MLLSNLEIRKIQRELRGNGMIVIIRGHEAMLTMAFSNINYMLILLQSLQWCFGLCARTSGVMKTKGSTCSAT